MGIVFCGKAAYRQLGTKGARGGGGGDNMRSRIV